jgi:chromosome segregation ATPase
VSPYALHIGLALVVIVVALGAWAILHSRASKRQYRKDQNDNYIQRSDLDHGLDSLRRELQHSIEASQAAATDIGEKVIAAVKPIESALRDFNNRIIELEARTETSDKLSVQLQSSLGEHERISEENARTVERINGRVERFEGQLMAAIDRLSSLKQMIEGTTTHNEKNGEALQAISASLAVIRSEIYSLSQRLDLKERDQTDLSNRTESIADSFASLKIASEKIAQRISDLETRARSRPVEQGTPSEPASVTEARTKENVEDESPSGRAKTLPVTGSKTEMMPLLEMRQQHRHVMRSTVSNEPMFPAIA